MSLTVESVESFLKDLLPKALVALIVPGVTFLWKKFRERDPEVRKKALLQEIRDLQAGLQSFGDIQGIPGIDLSRQATQNELQEKIANFTALHQTWPGSPAAEAVNAQAPEPTPAPAKEMRSGPALLQKWLLLYAPPRAIAWIPHTLFFFSIFGLLVTIPVAVLEAGKDPSIMMAPAAYAAMALICRFWAACFDNATTIGPVRRWFLLYPPLRPIGWLPRSLFFVSVLIDLSLVLAWVDLDERDSDDTVVMAFTLVFWLALTLIFRAWAYRIDVRQLPSSSSSPPTGIRQWLLLYIPTPAAAIILHVLFYLGLLCIVEGYYEYFVSGDTGVTFTNASGQSTSAPIFLALPLCYFVLVTLILRDWAATYHPAGHGARSRIRWLFPKSSVRPAGLLAQGLYYASTCILPLAMFQLFLDSQSGRLSLTLPFRSPHYLIWVSAPVVAIFISARNWVRSLDTPKALPRSHAAWLRAVRDTLILTSRSRLQPWVTVLIYFGLCLLAFAAVQPSESRLKKIITALLVLLSAFGWTVNIRGDTRGEAADAVSR